MATGDLGMGVSGTVYEVPVLTVLGTVNTMTLDLINKKFGDGDGYAFNEVPITNASA